MSRDTKIKPPVTVGELLELHIERFNHDGEGVGRYEGFTVFVPATAPGDRILARVISLQKSYARALLETVLTESSHRVTPSCAHYESCGGCQLQHLSYSEQLRQKQVLVKDSLLRLAGLDVPVLPVLGMDDPWRYRNKAQVPFGMDDNVVKAGFYEKRSHRIVNLDCCHIQHPSNDLAVQAVRDIAREIGVPVYNEEEHSGLLRYVMARTSFSGGETLVVLVTNGRHLPGKEILIAAMRKRLDKLTGIVQNINTSRSNAILGSEDITLWGKPYLTEELEGLKFRISPRSFLQVNTLQTKVLYDKVREYASLTGRETVFDLYCGIGTISLYLSGSADKIVGVESVNEAVRDARNNAALNQIQNAEFHTGTAENLVPDLIRDGYSPDVIIVDPPRKGCDSKLLAAMAAAKPGRIVYVSCNPATLARDLKYLTESGFHVREVQPVDMFPQTAHVETVVLITRV